MQKISERIVKILDNEGISTRAFELKIGASNGLIARCIGKGTDISSVWVSKIIETFPQYNAKWLLTGEGPMLASDVDQNNKEHHNLAEEKKPAYECGNCIEKERLIESLNERITELKDVVAILKNINAHTQNKSL